MEMQQYYYLKFVHFFEVQEWSVQFLQDENIKYNNAFPLVPIGKFLSRNKTLIEVQDDVIYKRPTIRTNNGGICLRDKKDGKQIGTKNQFLIKEGQFLLSKIDARNGAFGVVPNDCDKGIITGNFWTFDVDYSQINPHFLSLVTTTKAFINFAERASNGTTNRHYLQEDKFLKEKIPLPSIEEQNALVSTYNEQIHQAETLEMQAVNIEVDIEKYLLDMLGIEQATTKKHDNNNGFLQMVRFKDMERWDVLYYKEENSIKSNYNISTFDRCINTFMENVDGNSLRIETTKQPNKNFLYIGMENVEKETGSLIEVKSVRGETIKSQTVKVPNKFFLYGKLRPYLNKYWYNESEKANIVCSSEFFVFSIKNLINPYYFLYYLASKSVQEQIRNSSSGARMPRINEKIFKSIQIPLPDKPIQDEIVAHINSEKEEIKNKKAEAEKLRNEALAKFEKAIFE